MVTFPPLAPSSLWWAKFFQSLGNSPDSSLTLEEGIARANASLPSSRDFARYALLDIKGNPVSLSVPLVGGGRRLRNVNALTELQLSEHGDWRRNHLGALEACLGRKPFFRYFEHHIREAYLNPDLILLKDFNFAIFRVILSFLLGGMQLSDVVRNKDNTLCRLRGVEISQLLIPEISAIYPVAEFGSEALLGFLTL